MIWYSVSLLFNVSKCFKLCKKSHSHCYDANSRIRRPHEQLRVEVGFEQNFCDRVIYIWIDWKTLCVTVLDCWRDCMEKLTRFYWLLAILSKSNCGTSVDRLERSSWPFLQRTDSRCVDRMLIYSLQDQRLILAD